MSTHTYAIGLDFGTESGRAVLVDVSNGREVATAVHPTVTA
jgi:L-ribulokinase